MKKNYFLISKKNCLLIVIWMTLCMATAFSQMDCGIEEVPSDFGMLISPCIDMDIDEVPVKTIRVTFHIFQKDDGSENIQNDTMPAFSNA